MNVRKRIASALSAMALAIVVAVALTPATASAHQGGLHIGYVKYDADGKDTGSNSSLNGEWINIHNATSKSIQLKGYKLKDKAGHTYTYPSYSLGAGKSVKLHTGKGTNGSGHLYWNRTWYVWNNTGDTGTLYSPSGTKKDSCAIKKTSSGGYFCH